MSLLGQVNKRQPFSLPDSEITGEFRLIDTEQEAKAMAEAHKDCEKAGLNNDGYWVTFYEDCATLRAVLVESGTEIALYQSTAELRKSLTSDEVTYLTMAYHDFRKSCLPKFEDLTESKAQELLADLFAQKKSVSEMISSTNFRELKRLFTFSVDQWLQFLSKNGLSFISWNEPLMSIKTEKRPQKPQS